MRRRPDRGLARRWYWWAGWLLVDLPTAVARGLVAGIREGRNRRRKRSRRPKPKRHA